MNAVQTRREKLCSVDGCDGTMQLIDVAAAFTQDPPQTVPRWVCGKNPKHQENP